MSSRPPSPAQLRKRRIADDKRFARMRPKERNAVIRAILVSTLWWTAAGTVLFGGLAWLFSERFFLWIALALGILSIVLFFLDRRRARRLDGHRSVEQLQRMDPYDFEAYVVELYNRLGYSLEGVAVGADNGSDGYGTDPMGTPLIIQVKRYADDHLVGSPQVREFVGSMEFFSVRKGIFVTTGFFSQAAWATVPEVNPTYALELVDQEKLIELIREAYGEKGK